MSSKVARSTVMSSTPLNPAARHRLDAVSDVTDAPPTHWSVIVPVKQTSLGKSRLAGLRAEQRRALALAFALDTVTAAASTVGVRRVVVVTNDPDASAFERIGADVLPDRPDAGLNPAFVHGAQHVAQIDPESGVLGLAGDLPALTTEVLGSVLRVAPSGRWFVPDAAGTGTTLLAASSEMRLSPSFGPHSRAAHRAGGAQEVDLPGIARLRRDVDTEVDLWDAVRLGVGAHTQEALSRHELLKLA
ncbi:MAG TPA: 2-phospho-L-lactate guanylyltransferase [Nocardioidaceae bacterium]|jgi:2-phospho-L-lactate guanylyltransferase